MPAPGTAGGSAGSPVPGATRGRGILDDTAFLADALLELYQAGGDPQYLAAARELLDRALQDFAMESGGYYLSGTGADGTAAGSDGTGDPKRE